MKAVRLALRSKLRAAIPNLSRIDRFNRQYENVDKEDPIDFTTGAVFIEVLPDEWQQLGAQQLQEADATIRVHVCRTFLGDTFEDSNSDLSIMDLPGEVYKTLQGQILVDNLGRDIANALVRVNNEEDSNHDGLEVDILSFRTRLTDYLDDTSVNWETTTIGLEIQNDGIGTSIDPATIFAALASSSYSVDASGDTVTITWATANAQSVIIDALGASAQAAVGQTTITITENPTTIQLTATSGAVTVVRTIEVEINAACAPATWSLVDTATPTPNELDSGSIASGGSATIEAPDGTVTAKNSADTTLGSTTVRSGGAATINIGDVTHVDSDGNEVELPAGVPFEATLCATAPTLSVAASNATPAFGQQITITATASGFTPDSYTFSTPDHIGSHIITIVLK